MNDTHRIYFERLNVQQGDRGFFAFRHFAALKKLNIHGQGFRLFFRSNFEIILVNFRKFRKCTRILRNLGIFSGESMADEALNIGSLRAGPSWVEDTTSAPTRYVVSDTRTLTVHRVPTEPPKQPLDGETEKGVTFASASPRSRWRPDATTLNTPPSFLKPLGRSTTTMRLENTPRSSRRLPPHSSPDSEACADGSQASSPKRASY